METRASALRKADPTFVVPELESLAKEWLLDCELRQHSKQTLFSRRDYLNRFLWFLKHRDYQEVGPPEIKQFLLYLSNGHQEPGGRWGQPRNTKPMRPVTIHGYYRTLKTLFNWLVEDEAITETPMRRIRPPVVRDDVKQPISETQINALILAARASKQPVRNEALLLVLLDTGVRASELCSITMKDLDLGNRSFRVLGKGNKHRTCFLGITTTKALMKYLRQQVRKPDDPVFLQEGNDHGQVGLTKSGLFQLIQRLARVAGIPQCGPHTLRRTFAIEFLRASNGNVFACQNLMGHTDLQQTRLYCAIAQADIENQHRQFSPADRFRIK